MKLVDTQPATTSQPKVARVEIELDDGTVMIWKGEAALQYVKLIDNILALHQIRAGSNMSLPDPTLRLRSPGAGGQPSKDQGNG